MSRTIFNWQEWCSSTNIWSSCWTKEHKLLCTIIYLISLFYFIFCI